jgi:segregation and condensation protein B
MSRSEGWGLEPSDSLLEALLFVAVDPVSTRELAEAAGLSLAAAEKGLERLRGHYSEGHGLTVLNISGGWQLATAAAVEEAVASFRETAQSQRVRLSRAALESLAVVAYNQPVTRSEIEEIRGVRCDRVLDTLIRYGLIRIAGRKKGTGNPLLYRTTSRFLEVFGLDAVSALPCLDDLKEVLPHDDGASCD